eukprot:g38903.t1
MERALAPPGTREIWLIWHKERGLQGLWVWEAVAPEGYRSLGVVGTVTAEKPSRAFPFRCVANNLTRNCEIKEGGQIWNDRGSGGPDGAFWHLPDTDGTLCVLSSNTHARPAAQFPTWAEDLTLEIEALR